MPEFAFATLVTSDEYAKGALVVAAALRELHPSPPAAPEVHFETVCIVTPETVDVSTIRALRKAFDTVIGVEVIDGDQRDGLALLGRPDLHSVLTKLHVFRLTQYSKVIFLDADVLPVRPLSHLFTLPHEFSAVPDVGWPDIFNSGFMVLTPGEDKFEQIRELVKTTGSWDGGDQGVLNEWRGEDWHRLSFTYNTTPTSAYTYAPAYERFGSKISVIHFIGPNKPWKSAPWRPPFAYSSTSTATSHGGAAATPSSHVSESPTVTSSPDVVRQSYAYDKLVDRWFDIYDRHVRPVEQAPSAQPFEPLHYEPAWEAPSNTSTVYDLDTLKQLALEGSGHYHAPLSNGGGISLAEGHYISLPLDGRVDLMRPRPPTPPPVAESQSSHDANQSSVTSTPAMRAITHTEPPPPQGGSRSPPMIQWNPAVEPPPKEFITHPNQSSIPDHYPNVWDELPSSVPDDRPYSSGDPFMEQYHHEDQSPTEIHHPPSPHQMHLVPHKAPPAPKRDQFFPVIAPPAIPQEIAHQYSAVTSSAPNAVKSTSTFPWEAPRAAPRRVFPAGDAPKVLPPPARDPPKPIPQNRSPSPLPSNHVPASRSSHSSPVIQTNPALPNMPTSFQETVEHAQRLLSPISGAAALPAFEVARQAARSRYAPGDREAGSLTYSNAWDTIPSIDKYVSKLVKPPSSGNLSRKNKKSEPGGARDGRRSPPKSYEQAREEADDGDDEDDDGDSGDDGQNTPVGGRRRVTGAASSKKTRSRGGSEANPRGNPTAGRVYASQGVQTTPKSTASVGVQVSFSSPVSTPPLPAPAPAPTVPLVTVASRLPVVYPVGLASARTSRAVAAGAPPIQTTPPQPRSPPKAGNPFKLSPTKPLSPLVDDTIPISASKASGGVAMEPFASPRTASQAAVPPETRVLDSPVTLDSPAASRRRIPASPSMTTTSTLSPGTTTVVLSNTSSPVSSTATLRPRVSSNATDPTARSSWMSSSSSATIVEPMTSASSPEGMIMQPREQAPPSPRVATRKWDPARGVDVFKRDSQEVLARFLRMGSFADSPTPPS